MMPQLNFAFVAFSAFVVLLYWILPARWRTIFLAISGSAFLAYLDWISFCVLIALCILIFTYGRHAESKPFFLLCMATVLILFCGIRILQLLKTSGATLPYFVLIGYGFYSLKLIHYAVESRAGTFRQHGFLDFYNYMIFFPTISIGPIHRFEDFLKSDRRIHWSDKDFANGLERILFGYTKVIVLANWVVAEKFDAFASKLPPNTAEAIFVDSMVYGFYLYYAFAGYSDIAIGLGRLLGYAIPENFNYPYLKRNIGEFWQSWHMSLSSWCRQYVFLPVYAKWRFLPLALIGTMLAIALWHEFSMRFFFWGIYHGIGLLIWRMFQQLAESRFPKAEGRFSKSITTGISILATFLFVMIGFTIPRGESVQEITRNFGTLFGLRQ